MAVIKRVFTGMVVAPQAMIRPRENKLTKTAMTLRGLFGHSILPTG